MKQIASGITSFTSNPPEAQSKAGVPAGSGGSGTTTPAVARDAQTMRRAAVVTQCLRRLNATRRRATEADWTEAEMAMPDFLRPIWVLEGEVPRLRKALSLTCSRQEAAELIRVLRGLTGMSAEQRDRAEIMVAGFVAKLSEYPPIVAAEVVHDWTEREEFFPRSWSVLKTELDYVRGALEALAR